MFARVGRLAARRPWLVIAGWLIAATALVLSAPSLDRVTTGDQGSFVPAEYESARAERLAEQAFGDRSTVGALMVFSRADGGRLTEADQQRIAGVTEQLTAAGIERVAGVVTDAQLSSPDRSLQLAHVALTGELNDAAVADAVPRLRDAAEPLLAGSGLTFGVTGDAAMLHDSEEAFHDAERVVGIVTIVLIVGLLLLIFRSPVAALLPVLTVGLVLAMSSALIAALYTAIDVQTDQDLPVLLTVVLYGIGTDYTLFLLFRYRERLRDGDRSREAVVGAVGRVGSVILSAAAVVMLALLATVLAKLEFLTTLGPAVAIAVALMALAVLTLTPAVLSLTGPRVFWPSRHWRRVPEGTVSRAAGRAVARRPAVVAIGTGTILVGLAAVAVAYTPSYDLLDQLPGDVESVEAFETLKRGFPAGALNPTQVYVHRDDDTPLADRELDAVAEALAAIEGVGAVHPPQLSADRGTARIELLLEESPLSNAAMDVVRGPVRDTAHAAAPPGTTVLVGGTTATFADLADAYGDDLRVILPVAAVLIALVLGLLLRSVVAPWYLMVAVMVTFAASLGVGVLAIQLIGGAAGLIFFLPTLLYLFVTAIGTDYNILVVARIREEVAAGATPRDAVARAVEHAGPAVAGAALILAGTFSALLTAGVGFLTQFGLSVAAGILLAAVMAILLVPGLTAVIGRAAWWPGAGRRATGPAVPVRGTALPATPRRPSAEGLPPSGG